ncbi:polysaccharide pyruvyl transferase family protein [Arthrobacter sp. AOP36-C1-22]|uniref:polysaccharide pyruvyl transferase family protein n=1 Tax=Arthrobacter sp. AOP36-C1-22 TaxID=3457683 RepID=UPI0040349482
MKTTGLLDTSLKSENDGDRIIVGDILSYFPFLDNHRRVATHKKLDWQARRLVRSTDVLAVTGTNLLSSDIFSLRQWPLRPQDISVLSGKLAFIGVGWWQYQGEPNQKTIEALLSLMARDLPIAARDSYTAEKLTTAGIPAINTACPTMWTLPDTLPGIGQSSECVFTWTNYNPHATRDTELIHWLLEKYERVHIWPQSAEDERAIHKRKLPSGVAPLPRGLSAFASAMEGRDYVGTRLHAGIRAAQLGRPIAILAVDNRAMEIGKDTGLPVLPREADIDVIDHAYSTWMSGVELRLPRKAIAQWSGQFAAIASTA